MGLFKGIALFIGWLTSSMAGITAVFYACGYLVARAQLNLLGLFGLCETPGEQYLQEGAKFLTAVTVMLMGKLLPRLTLIFYAGAFLGVFVVLPLAVFFRGKSELWGKWSHWVVHCPAVSGLRSRPWLWRSLVLSGLAAFLVFQLLDYLKEFSAVLSISNLLYESPPMASPQGEAAQLQQWLLRGDTQRLHAHFVNLLKGELLAILVLIGAWHAADTLPARFWLVSPFVVIFVLYTIFTPMAYGVLVRPAKYPVVSLDWRDDPAPSTRWEFFLLNKSDRELVLWDSVDKKVLCVSADLVRTSTVMGLRPLFSTAAGGL